MTIEQATSKAAEVMAKLVVTGIEGGLDFDQAYKAAREYLIGRWAYLADLIPADGRAVMGA